MSELRIAVQVDGDERAVGTGTTAGDLLDGQGQDKGGDKGRAATTAMLSRRATRSSRCPWTATTAG